MNSHFIQLADYIVEHVDWITKAWVGAIERQPDIATSDSLTYRQLVDHLPYLCHDLADRVRNTDVEPTTGEVEHAAIHGQHRWEQGYRLDEVIRESGIIRHVFAVECMDAFAKNVPDFDATARLKVETVIHRFFDDVLIGSAQQFAEEKEKALLASEGNTAAILESALDSIIVIDVEGLICEWNPAAERMFGHTRDAVLGKELGKIVIPPEFRERHRQGLAHYLATGEGPLLGKRIEVPALNADGSLLLVELAITPSQRGEQTLFTAYLRDITQRRKDEEASHRLAAIVASSDDAVISKDLNGTITSWNQGAEKLFGYAPAEAIGQPITMLIPAGQRAEETTVVAQIGRGERVAPYETTRQRKDGSLFSVSLTVSPIKDATGTVVGASKIARDITERVRHEQRREAQYAIATLTSGESSLAEIAARVLEIVATTGPWVFGTLWLPHSDSGLVCHSTWQARGHDARQFEGQTISRVLQPNEGMPGKVFASGKPAWVPDVATDERFARRVAAAADDLHGTLLFPLTTATGPNGVIEILSNSIISPDEDLLRLVDSLGIQIGLYIERKQTEEELHRQKDAAESANQAKDRFLAALSHELRTPLTPVLMWACATAGDESLSPELREDIRMVCRNVELEARLIDDLLDLTRITQGKLQLKLQPCDAKVLLDHAVEIVRSQITSKNLQLATDFTAANHQILADPTRIQQVFWNLLKNAQKFTPENGRISVRSYDGAPGVLTLEITDTGRGIDPELMPKLFTAFQQGASAGEGLGLGLAICKAIVEMHGGKISARSEGPGTGATFTIELSTVAGQSVSGTTAERPSANPWRKLRILMVEDHEHTAVVMSRLLRRSGHEVTVANNVQSAMEILRTTRLDLLVSDLGLPDGNGFQVMRELAKLGDAKGIAVSGYGMDEDLAQSSAAGFSAHLVKPISPEQLSEAIKQVTNNS